MAVMVWTSDYRNANTCYLAMAGMVSVATKKNTSPAEIWYRRSSDGSSWSEPVFVGTLETSKAAHIHERNDGTLIVTNGIDAMWASTDAGRNWSTL